MLLTRTDTVVHVCMDAANETRNSEELLVKNYIFNKDYNNKPLCA
ncbi:MAG: hypothetical protein OXD44_09385 [Gammaproteobacteria bacterium]|nr:hypothetical protein [Gammaproteobacteria bacterium]MCY4226653.1 hypothetical protein [Gammaproteobacteria bacterium]MCY4313884.1 hypothetical protein [Gammaproteobacteria bacterium]